MTNTAHSEAEWRKRYTVRNQKDKKKSFEQRETKQEAGAACSCVRGSEVFLSWSMILTSRLSGRSKAGDCLSRLPSSPLRNWLRIKINLILPSYSATICSEVSWQASVLLTDMLASIASELGVCCRLNLPDSLPDLHVVKPFPERPQKGFFATLIGGGKKLDRQALCKYWDSLCCPYQELHTVHTTTETKSIHVYTHSACSL